MASPGAILLFEDMGVHDFWQARRQDEHGTRKKESLIYIYMKL
jgi:hypothetical protein